MAEINWGLAIPPNTSQTIVDGFQKGAAMAKEHKVNSALAQFATSPDDPNAVNALIKVDPRLGMQARQQQYQMANTRQEQEAKAREQQQQHFVQVGKLLDGVTDEASYQQRLAAARQMGMKVDGAPPSFDPNWVNQTRAVANVFTKDGGQTISTMARELQESGLHQGTPEFQAAMAQRIAAADTKTIPYTAGGGVAQLRNGQVSTLIQPNPGNVPAGTPVSTAPAATKVLGGKTYYNYGGTWHDAPLEGGAGSGQPGFPQ